MLRGIFGIIPNNNPLLHIDRTINEIILVWPGAEITDSHTHVYTHTSMYDANIINRGY